MTEKPIRDGTDMPSPPGVATASENEKAPRVAAESGRFFGLAALVEQGWRYSGRSDGYGRSWNVAVNVETGERQQWETPAEHPDCRCDICMVWRRNGQPPMHPDLA